MMTESVPAHRPGPVPSGVPKGHCSCGCGLHVKGLRRKATNKAADRMRRDLVLLSGALDDGTLDDPGEAEALLAEGAPLLAQLTSRVHGQLSRDDLDRDAVKAWFQRVAPHRRAGSLGTIDLDWHGSARGRHELTYGGVRAPGVVTKVRDTRTTVNEQIKVEVTIAVQPADGPEHTVSGKVYVSRVSFPRVGDRVEVAYDPADPQSFVYRPLPPEAAPAPAPAPVADDRVAALQALAELHASGVLSDEELAAEKQRLLGG